MKNIILLNKKEGETPLQALEDFREKNKKYRDVKMTYAGRLDPMVSGLLLVLAGDTVKQKEKYLKLSKEYKFDVLFGFATDTYDILGKVTNSKVPRPHDSRQRVGQVTNIRMKEVEKKIKNNLRYFTGKFIQSYPMYSSRTVKGKPLFMYARGGQVVSSPKREVNVESLKFYKIKKISSQKFLDNIERRVAKVKGDFRQEEILRIWRKELKSNPKHADGFLVANFHIKCGSGTYVRGISNSLGEKIGIPALALSIKRTKIGKWSKM